MTQKHQGIKCVTIQTISDFTTKIKPRAEKARSASTILSGQDSQMPMSLAEELNEFIAGDDGRKNVICSAVPDWCNKK